MQNLTDTFGVLTEAIRKTTAATGQMLSSLGVGGLAASGDVAAVADGSPSRISGAFTAEKFVFEGLVNQVFMASWSGDDVLSDSVGMDQSTSGVVEEFRLAARHPAEPDDYLTATKVIKLSSSSAGYWTGEMVAALVDGQQIASKIDVLAMSLNAGPFPFEIKDVGSVYAYSDADEIASVYLDGVYNSIAVGDLVVVEADGEVMASEVSAVYSVTVTTIDDLDIQTTLLEIKQAAKIGQPVRPQSVRIWFNAKKAGTLERIPTKTVAKDDFLNKACPVTLAPNTTLPTQDTFIVIQDAEGTTLRAKGGGQGSSENPQIMITELLEEFDGELVKPITFLWGLTKVTRGKTVNREIIGSGDATRRWQSFRLAKSPLTYVADPFAPGGRRPEVDVYVNGVKWRRAQSFYKATPQDEIYVLRYDAEHNTFVQFGDGDLGKRLPTGANNVVATYRFGVGGNVEANAINKLVRPIKGVTSVFNPLPATGGEDPPTEAEAREKAIASTRVLGHLVSVVDFEVEAARYGGVVRAKALWGWDQAADDAVVKVWIICADEGDPSADLRTYLMNMAEPEVRVEVSKATPLVGELAIDLDLDPNYLPEDIHAAVDARLFDEFEGLLAPRNVPIGSAFYRSELYAAIHEIEGVRSVLGVLVNGNPMPTRILLEEGQYLALAYPEAG